MRHSGKEFACQCRRYKRCGFDSGAAKNPWSRKWQPTPVFLHGKFHGQRSLVGYSPWGHKELDMTEYTHTREIYYYERDLIFPSMLVDLPIYLHSSIFGLYNLRLH